MPGLRGERIPGSVSFETGSGSWVYNEVPAGSVNSSNATFTLAAAPVTGTLTLYLNGQRLKGGGEDFSLSGLTITMTTAPTTGDILLADYQSITSTFGNADTLDGFDSPYFWQLPQGHMINGKLSVTVVSSDLIVAVKTLAGADPSASDPVQVRIGDTVRSITAALSVTAADATNWFNAGSAELAAKEIDYFAYLGYNATDGVVIGFSRVIGHKYGDFSATTTNERFNKISTITTAASTDYYEVVGRFAATLSAGAGYTWTVPTFTALNLIQRPIYETRWLAWAPTLAGGTSPSVGVARYKIGYKICFILGQNFNIDTSNATTFTFTLPISTGNNSLADPMPVPTFYKNNSVNATTVGYINVIGNTNTLSAYTSFYAGAWTAAAVKTIWLINFFYELD